MHRGGKSINTSHSDIRKKNIKLSLFKEEMIIHAEKNNANEYREKVLKLANRFRRVIGYSFTI